MTVDGQSGRPLAEAVRELERRHGWVITYEDTRHEHPDDIEDVTAIVRRDGDRSKPVLVPRGFPFTFDYGAPDASAGWTAIVDALVQEHSRGNYPGNFHTVHIPGMSHVIPETVRGAGDTEIAQRSVLATRISSPEADRTVDATLDTIVDAVTKTAGTHTWYGMAPVNLLVNTRIRQGARDEVARDVLIRTLAATGRRMSWQLFYGPVRQDYALNVHLVSKRCSSSKPHP